jgi:hypothetical protein
MLKSLLTFGLTRRPIILLGLLVFVGGGFVAYTKLNIEAYPNPAPVILEITAQSAGLSAEEMERYFTIPMEVGLAPTPGVANIRLTSFYGLSFVRVTFNYSVDYYFALTQAALSLQQNVSLPNNVQPQIQGSSLVGEVYRYQVTGPPHFGLTNLRTIQDWILQRRLLRRRQGLRRLYAATGQGRPRQRGRRGGGDRRDEPHDAHQRRGAAHQGRDRKDQHRRQPAARRETGAVLRPHRSRRRDDPHRHAQPDLRLPVGVSDPVGVPRRSAQRDHRRRQRCSRRSWRTSNM